MCPFNDADAVERALDEHDGDVAAIILEPVGRNTAPAVAVAALVALEKSKEKSKGTSSDADPVLLHPAVRRVPQVERDRQRAARMNQRQIAFQSR